MEIDDKTRELSDEDIVSRIIDGDSFLFECIVERYFDALMRYGKKFIVDDEDIKDLIQEVFIKVYENIKRFDVSRRFKPWIYRVAHNVFVNHLRFRSRLPFIIEWDAFVSLPIKDEKYEKDKENEHIRRELETYLSNISASYREVLLLYYIEEMSYKDIAEVLHIPTSSVGVRISRAKGALKEEISKNETRD